MAAYPGFVDPSNTLRSRNVNAERTINFYLESAAPGTPKVSAWLVPTPGVQPFAVCDNGPIRALFAQDGRCWAVGGSTMYEVFASGNVTNRGTATADGRPATISSNGPNGGQLFVTSGGLGYVYNLTTNVIAPVTTNAEPVQMGAFSDGYFFALKANSNQFNISALNDGLTWDPLDVYQVSTVSDQIVTLVESHRDIWLLGSQTSSVWNNTGDADNPYQPIPGVKIANGSAAAFSAAVLDNTIFWLGGNELGNRVVYRANGYTPQRISDHGVEYALNQIPRVSDAIGWAYQDEGHAFYCLYIPLAETTWVYDVSTSVWHERAIWDSVDEVWRPDLGRCHCYAFGRHLIGDRNSGTIFELSLDFGDYVLPDGYPGAI